MPTIVKPATWQEKLAESDKLFKQAKAILTNQVEENGKTRQATAEEKGHVEQMMKDARQYKAEAAQLKEIEIGGEEIQTALGQADDSQTKDDDIARAEQQRKQKGTKASFPSWGEFLQKAYTFMSTGQMDPRLVFVKYDDGPSGMRQSKDLAESVGASGGFLVPPEIQNNLYSIMAEQSQIRKRATVIPMRRRSVLIPVLDQTSTTAGIPHWFGGMRFYWAEEASEKTQSDPSFRQIELVAHKLVGYTRASDELLDDSAISLEAFLQGPMGFSGGAIWTEEYTFLNGTGAGQPLGIINAGATIASTRKVANTVGFDDLADMVSQFLPTGKGVWMISQSLMSDLIQLNGPTGNPSYIWQPNARDGIPGSILGFPVIWTEKVPIAGTSGDVILADWTYYLIGDRQSTTVETTKFDRWRYDQTSWRMVHRVDGQPWLSTPLTLQDGTTQISPFVLLSSTTGS